MSKVDQLPQRPPIATIVFYALTLTVSAPIFFTEHHSTFVTVVGAIFYGAVPIAACFWVRDFRRYEASVRAGEQPRRTSYPNAPDRI